MNRLIAILTGLHVLAHGIFGCCDHSAVEMARGEQACACHGAHHEDHDVAAAGCGTIDRQLPARAPHECVHASCHWVIGSAGPSVAPHDFSVPLVFMAILPNKGSALHSTEFQPNDVRGRTSAPPLRLHLALGVIVV